MSNLTKWTDAEFTANATEIFSKTEDALRKYQWARWESTDLAQRKAAKSKYDALIKIQQPIGEVMLAETKQVIAGLESKLQMPEQYTSYKSDLDFNSSYIAGNINTAKDLSLTIQNRHLQENDQQQISFEVRVFVGEPKAIIFFKVGSRNMLGQYIYLGTHNGNVYADSKEQLLDKIVVLMADALSNHEKWFKRAA